MKSILRKDLENATIIQKIPFATSTVSGAQLSSALTSYVASLIDNYSGLLTKVYPASGWICVDGSWAYLDGEKAIGLPNANLRSQSTLSLHNNMLQSSLWGEYQQMRTVTQRPESMDILLLYTLSSFLYTPLKEAKAPLKHVLFLMGQRATRKTSLALCFTQLEHKDSPKFNFTATESGIQAHLCEFHDACILIDDLAPSLTNGKKQERERKLESIVRLFGDSGERVINTYFMKENADKIDYRARGGAVITGEYFYSAGVESSIARAVVLELEPDSVNLEVLSYFQQHPEILETLVYRLLDYVSQNFQMVIPTIRQVFTKYRSMWQQNFSNGRFAEYGGQYMAVACMLMQLFQRDSGLSQKESNGHLQVLESEIFRVLSENDRKMQTHSPVYTKRSLPASSRKSTPSLEAP